MTRIKENSAITAAGAADLVRFGFGYMMNFQGGQEVSEFGNAAEGK
jgi:hypothetical protein